MNRPKDPIELQAMEAWIDARKTNPDIARLAPIMSFIEGYKAACRDVREVVDNVIQEINETPKQ